MVSVIAGCLIGLVINHVFRKITSTFFPPTAPTAIAPADIKKKADGGE
jgi:hypothetical protein